MEKSYFTGNEEQFYDSYNANLTFLRTFLAFGISILEDKTEIIEFMRQYKNRKLLLIEPVFKVIYFFFTNNNRICFYSRNCQF